MTEHTVSWIQNMSLYNTFVINESIPAAVIVQIINNFNIFFTSQSKIFLSTELDKINSKETLSNKAQHQHVHVRQLYEEQ